jgi:hypothetical protein
MRIILCYRPLHLSDGIVSQAEGETMFERELVLKDGAGVKDIPRKYRAKSLAPYDRAKTEVVGDYIEHGLLKDGQCYMILSGNTRGTINAMKA